MTSMFSLGRDKIMAANAAKNKADAEAAAKKPSPRGGKGGVNAFTPKEELKSAVMPKESKVPDYAKKYTEGSKPPSGFGTGSKGRARAGKAPAPAIAKKDEVKSAKVLDSKQAAGNTKTMKKGGNVKKMAIGGLPKFSDITKGPSGALKAVDGKKPALAPTMGTGSSSKPKTQTGGGKGAVNVGKASSKEQSGGKGTLSGVSKSSAPAPAPAKPPTGGKGSASTKGGKLAGKKKGGTVKKMAKGGKVKKMALGGMGAGMIAKAPAPSQSAMQAGAKPAAGGPKGGRSQPQSGGAKPAAGGGKGVGKTPTDAMNAYDKQKNAGAATGKPSGQMQQLSQTMKGQQATAPAPTAKRPTGGKGGAQAKATPPAPAPTGGKGGPMRPGKKNGGAVKKMAKGGSASSRGDGIAVRGKTKGKVC